MTDRPPATFGRAVGAPLGGPERDGLPPGRGNHPGSTDQAGGRRTGGRGGGDQSISRLASSHSTPTRRSGVGEERPRRVAATGAPGTGVVAGLGSSLTPVVTVPLRHRSVRVVRQFGSVQTTGDGPTTRSPGTEVGENRAARLRIVADAADWTASAGPRCCRRSTPSPAVKHLSEVALRLEIRTRLRCGIEPAAANASTAGAAGGPTATRSSPLPSGERSTTTQAVRTPIIPGGARLNRLRLGVRFVGGRGGVDVTLKGVHDGLPAQPDHGAGC